jgi:hypothetical protein
VVIPGPARHPISVQTDVYTDNTDHTSSLAQPPRFQSATKSPVCTAR